MMTGLGFYPSCGLFTGLDASGLLVAVPLILGFATVIALVTTSRHWANEQVPFAAGQSPIAILYQQYRFVVDGPALIKEAYARFSNGLFEIPRTFRPGQVILCNPQLIEELRTTRSTVASPEPWIDQLLQISHVMPGYFPKGGGWPAIAKTTPGVIRGTVHKQLDRYVPSMNDAILTQLHTLDTKSGHDCLVNCFDFAYSVVVRSGSYSLVGSRLANDEEYLKAVKDHILGMIVTTRVQFMVPDWLKRYIGGLISRLATLGTNWDMNASRAILIKHFNARAAEYYNEMAGAEDDSGKDRTKPEDGGRPVEIFRWLYESAVLRHRWTYAEVIGEMLLLQFAFIYTTSYALYGALIELVRRPEYTQPLREEAESMLAKFGVSVAACDQMILLDSFFKECQRLHPPAAVSAHRVCVKPLELSNEQFDGFRFAQRAAEGAENSKLVDLSPDFLVFGMGVQACPGRWMASALMKLAFAHLLSRFDIVAGSAQGPLTGSLSFEEFYVPNFGLKVCLRRRDDQHDQNEHTHHPPVLNPSAVAAETRMKPALSDDKDVSSYGRSRPTQVELSFGMPAQQFLDPPAWEAMLKKHKETQSKESSGDDHNDPDFETTDQRQRREEREAEYGSMAIQSRSSLRGRGRREKGQGRIS
ncbi:Cytochrome P450 [Penicillium capsulatum]|uniref:Cytochrome P450 n=1 Tax=Penicillium capsulatum TaxID=69766 RepID=A0A9W9HTP5_9EURO|nr:Cytochrome P450 [Penicillium capsulatum]KAJ6106363.1 Cytochrome P450 [Penicillium capsulatum]